MPVITFEKFKELRRDPKFLDGLKSNVLTFVNSARITDENRERMESFKGYLEAIDALSDPDASDETIKQNLKKLDGFNGFLGEKDIKDETNFDKLKKDIPSLFDTVWVYIENISRTLGLQLAFTVKNALSKNAGKEDRYIDLQGKISADKYIERIRDNEFKEFNPNRLSDEELDKFGDRILHIMAARQLANSDRGKVAKLKAAKLDPKDINARVEEMKGDPAFQSFIAKIKYDPDSYKKAFLAGQATPGHGGKLDDMFKEHMLNLPPGLMPNSKLHDRYMPTAKARIESIQNQIKKKDSFIREYERAGDSLSRAEGNALKTRYYGWLHGSLQEYAYSLKRLEIPVCEVTALRNLVKADYGKKESLDKRIPTFEEDTLRRDSARITDSSNEHTYISNHSEHVKALLLKGHGGDMADEFRSYVNRTDVDKRTPGLLEFALTNSIQVREKELKADAKTLKEQIEKEKDAEKKKELLDKGKVLIGEYLILCAKSTDPVSGKTSYSLTFRDTPWGKINELHEKGVEIKDESLEKIKLFNEEDVTDLLGRINKDEMRLVVDPIKTRMIGASYRKPKPEAKAGNNEPKIGK